MKNILIQSNVQLGDSTSNNEILKAGGVKRIHDGWYRCFYNGVLLSRSTICKAEFVGLTFPDSSVSSV